MSFRTRLVIIALTAVAGVLAAVFYPQNNLSPTAKLQDPQSFAHLKFFGNDRGPASSHGPKNRPQSVLFKLKENATAEQKAALDKVAKQFDLQIRKKVVRQKVHFAKSSKYQTSEEELAKAVFETGAVEFAETDKSLKMSSHTSDPYLGSQWHLPKIHGVEAWNEIKTRTSVLVATCDTGVESSHPDLTADLQLPGYNAEDGSANSEAINPHGTMTAGTIAATINNRIGIAGVAENVKIMPIRITNSADGVAYISTMAACIEYAADHGAKIVNLSYGGADSYTIDMAAQYLRSKGGLLVMAAGNEGQDISMNADFTSFVIVGATDQNDTHPSWSNFGTPIDLVAPGSEIFTTAAEGSYAWASGTSFAAPVVAGVAAMIFAVNPNFTPSDVENILYSSATRLGSGMDDPTYGSGRVDALAAVQLAKQSVGSKPPSHHHRRKARRAF